MSNGVCCAIVSVIRQCDCRMRAWVTRCWLNSCVNSRTRSSWSTGDKAHDVDTRQIILCTLQPEPCNAHYRITHCFTTGMENYRRANTKTCRSCYNVEPYNKSRSLWNSRSISKRVVRWGLLFTLSTEIKQQIEQRNVSSAEEFAIFKEHLYQHLHYASTYSLFLFSLLFSVGN